MKPDLTKKDFDVIEAAEIALDNREFLLELIGNLKSRKEAIRFSSSRVLEKRQG